ncbi:cobalt-precorrin-6A reductase [Tessaracoccus sp. OH4464_COT-324]|uniref:cobalt-precorrin-6A reductase n=1 Tax=Tessaracoccus sp. OH4464_COT-324 TaxID=2491059 RepID=UPI000F62E387|nr:cobalt-precorrin-6A reductase [Tessaracoccus sp. OH4464_COT-324]RRD45981.1 cobalt-precorrin-6A reductase [Tessaracoccus sp. OH4464_COT-324]
MKILILGGTRAARQLAEALLGEHQVISSLAGRTKRATLPPGDVRVGHFGGVAGLVEYLEGERVELLINATHPFADTMSANAHAAAAKTGTPHLRLTRDSWAERPDAPGWLWVNDHREAARRASEQPGAVLLTIGRLNVAEYLPELAGRRVICRVVDPPEVALPDGWRLLRDRGPFTLADELALLRDEGVGVVVTKDSGGQETAAKLDAARQLGARVVMIARPKTAGEEVTSVADALDWVRRAAQNQSR